ncbi:hypothetical protein DUI70_2321 [Streptomyces albus]|nr:hypothetical protein DUI70_2321 [Streptomyces albus]
MRRTRCVRGRGQHALHGHRRSRCAGFAPGLPHEKPPRNSLLFLQERFARSPHGSTAHGAGGYGTTPPQRMAVHGTSRVGYPFCTETRCIRSVTHGTFGPRRCGSRHRSRRDRDATGPDRAVHRRSGPQPRESSQGEVTWRLHRSPGRPPYRAGPGPISPSGNCADRAHRASSRPRCAGRRARSASASAATRGTWAGWRRARSAAPTTPTSGCSGTCSPAAPSRTWASPPARRSAAGARPRTRRRPREPPASPAPGPPADRRRGEADRTGRTAAPRSAAVPRSRAVPGAMRRATCSVARS